MNHKTVILLHGIWTRGHELFLLRRRLARSGLKPVLFSYPAVSAPYEENVQRLASFIRALPDAGSVALVGHSYGGLVACGLTRAIESGLIRRDFTVEGCVFMGSPVAGSTLARRLGGLGIVRLLTGRSLPVLRRGCSLSGAGVKTLMIAGTLNIGFGMLFLQGPADGMVALSDTRAPWLGAHTAIRASHLGLLLSRRAADACIEFLHGIF